MTPGGMGRRALAPAEGGPQVLAALLLAGALGTGTALGTIGSGGSAFAPPAELAGRAAASREPQRALARQGPKPASPGVLDLNTADARALAALPGIGAELAARIVAERAARGPFASPEELRRVPGIGPGRLERIRPLVGTTDRP
jgi:competence ComEA-like helix-hairpin-helix protein